MIIAVNRGGVASTNAYLVADETTKQAVIFDAPDGTLKPLIEKAKTEGYDVIGLWLTHGHFDHIADHAEVTAAIPNAKVLIHRLDDPKLRRPNMMAMFLPFTISPRTPDGYLDDGQKLQIGSLELEVIHTPGHAPGHVMFHFPQQKILIGGDLIIMGAVGRTDFPDCSVADLNASIRKVMKLPDDTQLLPGHGDVSTLADERRENPYVNDALEETEA